MHSLLWFMLCCFVLEILNKTYFICEMLEWPAIKQTLQAPRFTLYLNFANNFKPAAPTPWAILLAQVHLQECRPTPAAHTGPQQKRLHCPISLQIFTATSPSNLGLVLLQISSFISEKALLRIPLLSEYSIPVSDHSLWCFVIVREVSIFLKAYLIFPLKGSMVILPGHYWRHKLRGKHNFDACSTMLLPFTS